MGRATKKGLRECVSLFYALRFLGVPADKLRIAAVWDCRKKEGHAVLLVCTDNGPLVLDNLSDRIFPLANGPGTCRAIM